MRPRLFGLRIMDDSAAVVYLADDAQTEVEAVRLLQATKYHETLILEQTFDAGRLSDTGEPRGGPAEEVSPTVLQRYCTDQHTL